MLIPALTHSRCDASVRKSRNSRLAFMQVDTAISCMKRTFLRGADLFVPRRPVRHKIKHRE